MKVYQLRLLDLGMNLEQVFKSREKAELYQKKYKNRRIVIKQYKLDEEREYVYRILKSDHEGYELKDEIYETLEVAYKDIKDENERVVKENITDSFDNYELVEV